MPTFPYFNSGYSPEEIAWANHCREQDELKLAEQEKPMISTDTLHGDDHDLYSTERDMVQGNTEGPDHGNGQGSAEDAEPNILNWAIPVLRDLMDAEAKYRSAIKIYADHPMHPTRLRAESGWWHAKNNAKAVLRAVDAGEAKTVSGDRYQGDATEVVR